MVSKSSKTIKRIKKPLTLFDKLVVCPEQFSFVKAIDVAAKVCDIKFLEIKSNINFSSKFTDISHIEGLKDGFAEIHTNLSGIAGIEGILPDCYTEEFILYNRFSKKSVIDFFDIFNERILLLRYNYLKSRNVPTLSVPIEKSSIGTILFSLSGISSSSNSGISKSNIPEQFKVSVQNLLWRYTKSASGLKAILSSFFKIPINIKQFSGSFLQVDKSEQSAIGIQKGRYNSLGKTTILGDKIWDQTKGIDIVIGPLDYPDYIKFLPKISRKDEEISPLQKMKEIVKIYVPFGINVKLCFYLKECYVKSTILNSINRLNKDTFISGWHNKKAYFIERV